MTEEEQLQHIPEILEESAAQMRKMASDLSQSEAENAALRDEMRRVKLALRLEERGLEPGLSREEKIAALSKLSAERLGHVEAAAELVPGGFSLGNLSVDEAASATSTKRAGALYSPKQGEDDLDNFVLSQQALS